VLLNPAGPSPAYPRDSGRRALRHRSSLQTWRRRWIAMRGSAPHRIGPFHAIDRRAGRKSSRPLFPQLSMRPPREFVSSPRAEVIVDVSSCPAPSVGTPGSSNLEVAPREAELRRPLVSVCRGDRQRTRLEGCSSEFANREWAPGASDSVAIGRRRRKPLSAVGPLDIARRRKAVA